VGTHGRWLGADRYVAGERRVRAAASSAGDRSGTGARLGVWAGSVWARFAVEGNKLAPLSRERLCLVPKFSGQKKSGFADFLARVRGRDVTIVRGRFGDPLRRTYLPAKAGSPVRLSCD